MPSSAGTTAALSSPRRELRPAHAAVSLCKRALRIPLREWRKRLLRTAYSRGFSKPVRAMHDEVTDPAIIEAGRLLRQQLLSDNERKHSAAGYRVLMLHPSGITSDFWFGDLGQCMRHAGIECQVLPHDSSAHNTNAMLEVFQPNVFIALESPQVLRTLDLVFLQAYKHRHGCLRLFVPVWHTKAPGGYATPGYDQWRRRLRWGGFTADAYFSIFEPEFHERFSHDPAGPALEYAAIPMACNPFSDYPVAATKQHDYFMATSLTNERLDVSYDFLRPILKRYRGLWAGPGWGFGMERIAPQDMRLRYAQARIALSPLVKVVHRYGAELTHRVYAGAACGAFQLTMPTPITGRYFRPHELVQAASPAEYARLFDHYVHSPNERNVIALAALRRVYAEHTCFHRIDKLVSCWENWGRCGLF
jgi:Glycosyl transferases group 1